MKLQFANFLAATLSAVSLWHCASAQNISAVPIQPSRSTLQTQTFFSKALQRTMPYEVVLPPAYASSQERYPVLYLLHGWHGDETNYTTLTTLLNEASAYKLIIVLPRGENSWYVNSATVPADRFGDYIFADLAAEIDTRFRSAPQPMERAIAGLSMGGYGALLLSLQHPGAFGFVGSLSGAFDGPSGIERVMPVLKQSTDTAFGSSGDEARGRSDLAALIAVAVPSAQPYFFLACGASDPLLDSDRKLVAQLSSRRFVYEYHELPGSHTWTFWNGELRPLLASLASAMHVAHVPGDAATSAVPPTTHL